MKTTTFEELLDLLRPLAGQFHITEFGKIRKNDANGACPLCELANARGVRNPLAHTGLWWIDATQAMRAMGYDLEESETAKARFRIIWAADDRNDCDRAALEEALGLS